MTVFLQMLVFVMLPFSSFMSDMPDQQHSTTQRGKPAQPACAKQSPQPFVTNCNPFGASATHTDADAECPIAGDSKSGTPEFAQDVIKNNFCADGAVTDITIPQLAQLQQDTINKLGVKQGNPPKNRNQLATSKDLSFHEKDLVRLKAFVQGAETADIAQREGGESVNCNIGPKNGCSRDFSVPRNDIHIALVAVANDQTTCDSVTAEVTPHLRPAAWNEDTIKALKGKLVRIRGQLMYDGSHSVCVDGKGSPPRQSLWEIHPVYGIEVCQQIVNGDCSEKDWKPF